MKLLFTPILLVCLSSLVVAQDDDAANALERAKAAFDAARTELEESILKWFGTQEDRARSKGDRKALTTIQTQRMEFLKGGRIPDTAPKSLRRRRELIVSKMEAAYMLAIRDFTRAGNDQLASQTEKQLEEFRQSSLTMPDRRLWKHGGGSFASAEKGTWDEKISDGRSFRYKEIDRNEEYVELEALTGNKEIRIRIYDDRAEIGHKPSLVFKKHLEGSWAE